MNVAKIMSLLLISILLARKSALFPKRPSNENVTPGNSNNNTNNNDKENNKPISQINKTDKIEEKSRSSRSSFDEIIARPTAVDSSEMKPPVVTSPVVASVTSAIGWKSSIMQPQLKTSPAAGEATEQKELDLAERVSLGHFLTLRTKYCFFFPGETLGGNCFKHEN